MERGQMDLGTEDFPIGAYLEWTGEGVALWWLGQAGFLIRYGKKTLIVDAYLSDFLAREFPHKPFPHTRMMESPIDMNALKGIDYSLSTHAHGDHLDPGLVPVLGEVSPSCGFVVPEASRDEALDTGIPEGKLMGLNAGESLSLGEGMTVTAIPAAHEVITRDEKGRHLYLGYIFDLGGYRIYHSGDCMPYEGLDRWLESFHIDLALLPVNGQNNGLSKLGILGNFSAEQACQIMRTHDFSFMIPHHFDLFAFNTVSREELNSVREGSGMGDRILLPEAGLMYHLLRKKSW